jgi:hypothetical protein
MWLIEKKRRIGTKKATVRRMTVPVIDVIPNRSSELILLMEATVCVHQLMQRIISMLMAVWSLAWLLNV